MKIQRSSLVANRASRRDGAALIIALCFLVIMSAVLLALFSSTRNDLVNSKIYASGQATTLLAETAVNLVEGQITDASTQPLHSWASQPGMIHTYDTSGNSTAYKLYSSDTNVVSGWGGAAMTNETTAMQSWKSSTDSNSYNAMWCDLNAPAVVNRTSATNAAVTVATPVFPIVDPGAVYFTGVGGVEGFGFVGSGSGMVPGTSYPASANDANRRLPMPVKWMYLLKNGQLIAPTSMSGTVGTSTVATFGGAIQPASTNQIVGRIAFWADDDTCKLNINTASEGTYWDAPRAAVQQEWLLGLTLPILGEFQAISGHPATTCLDPVLGDLLPRPTLNYASATVSDPSGSIATLNVPYSSGSYASLQPYYAMNPRISDIAELYNPYNPSSGTSTTTTSEGGTVNTMQPAKISASNNNENDNLPTVVYKSDRLYATPDELLFNPTRGFNPNWSDNTANNSTSLTAATLAQRDFFLTAQSRASETTLFGTPRISMWPIQQTGLITSQVNRSARDNLIHFCATVGGTNYDFQRGQVSVYNGGYQANPAAASISTDWSIARNQSLFGYATSMMESTAPGFGTSTANGSLGTKWGNPHGSEREMTLAMDMIRSSLSLVGTTTNTTPYSWSYRNEISPTSGTVFRGSVIPLQVTTASGSTYNGIGRDWRVASAAIQVVPTARMGGGTNTAYFDGWGPTDAEPATTYIQAILLLNFYNPMPTPQILEPSFRVTVSNTGVGVNNSPIGTGTVLLQYGIGGGGIPFARSYPFTGYAGLLYAANSTDTTKPRTLTPNGTDPTNSYPFVTSTVMISQPGTTNFTINPGTITIQIQENGETSTKTVQTESLYFPGWTGPLPQYVSLSGTQGIQNQTFPTASYSSFPNLTNRTPGLSSTSSTKAWFQPGDVVREVQLDPNGPTKGDYRLLATASSIPTNWFAPNTNYASSFNPFATWTNTTPSLTSTTAIAAAIGSMTNRFAFAFPIAGNPNSTYGYGNGYDSTLDSSPRYSGVANTGVTYLGPINSPGQYQWSTASNYTNNVGGLVSTLPFVPASASSPESPPFLPPTAPALANPPSTTAPASGWAPSNANGGLADWSTDFGWDGDGGMFSAPDTASWFGAKGTYQTDTPYYFSFTSSPNSDQEGLTEPNRMAPSPIALFGSLPTPTAGVTNSADGYGDDLQPWQSMLLCPNPLAGNTHPGFGQNTTGTGAGPTALPPFSKAPPDHLFIDLFWMPVVDPYAISDPLSTAGKVNLNYGMEPFTHITRRTALLGVLTPVNIGAITNTASLNYKQYQTVGSSTFANLPNPPTRFPLNLDTNNVPGGTPPSLFAGTSATGSFTDFETRFASGDVFRSASEVCMIDLAPYGVSTGTALSSWWANNALTGLNMRESPYNQIYSRITTKSNTYTVHYWVQSLQQASFPGKTAAQWAQWNEAQDVISGEYRGNTTIERYLDPNTTGIPDYTTNFTANSTTYTPIDKYYSWRVVMQKQFAPGSN